MKKVEVFGRVYRLDINLYSLIIHRNLFAVDFWKDRNALIELMNQVASRTEGRFLFNGYDVQSLFNVFYTAAVTGGTDMDETPEELMEAMNLSVTSFVLLVAPVIRELVIKDSLALVAKKGKANTNDKKATSYDIVNRALEMGISVVDMKSMKSGQIIDLLTSRKNEEYEDKKRKKTKGKNNKPLPKGNTAAGMAMFGRA